MSIGWPIASSVAGHLLIRYGTFHVSFCRRDIARTWNNFICHDGCWIRPWWAAMASFFVGVGMGLTSTSFIVTIQGAVPREKRGSATAANMFMRNFGNTVGAALFGAILNGSLMVRFKKDEFEL